MQLLVVDLDDTLLCTGHLYEQAKEDAADVVLSLAGVYKPQLTKEEVISYINKLDLARAKAFGLYPARFAESLVEATRDLLELQTMGPALLKQLWSIGHQPLKGPWPPLAGSQQFLQLFQDHQIPVIVLTEGDDTIQREKLRAFPYSYLLTGARVVARKSTEVLQQLLEDHGVLPNEAWVVGNSYNSDIIPALEAGCHAALLDGYSWARDTHGMGELLDEVFISPSLVDIAQHILAVEELQAA